MPAAQYTKIVRETAAGLGFDFCGIARAEKLDEDARRLEAWLNKGFQGTMSYMERYFDQRIDPTLLVPGAKSVITLLLNYYPAEKQNPDAPKIARYAWGVDYHDLIRDKLNRFIDSLRESIGEVNGRGFVDSAPVLERTWAQKSGLGWVGRNGNLLNREIGSWFFIATLITDLDLVYDNPHAKDYCGSCRRCIDACPTEAIQPDKVVDGSRCISYFTIELKDALIPDEMRGKFENWAFGCDICQEVCPWNRFSTPHRVAGLEPVHEILEFSWGDWQSLTEEKFRTIFRHSPLRRPKFRGLQRNLRFLRPADGESPEKSP
jgi:epoxyqueuosine reductase